MIGRVEKRKQDTRQRIAHAALELFAKKGIDATTIAEISEAADIGKGTFFTYFPTKEDVFTEAGSLILERIAASLQAVPLDGDGSASVLLERARRTRRGARSSTSPRPVATSLRVKKPASSRTPSTRRT